MKIFLSGVSTQFRECRISLASDLRSLGAEVVVQEDFRQRGVQLLEKLQDYIESCDRVIILVGDTFGFEATYPDASIAQSSRSYTQWEYYFALGERLNAPPRSAKPLYVYVADDTYKSLHQVAQSTEHHQRQTAFIEEVKASGRDRSSFSTLDELCRLVIRDGFQLPQPSGHDLSGLSAYLKVLASHLDRIDVASPTQAMSSSTSAIHVSGMIDSVCTQIRVRRILQLATTQDNLDTSNIERDAFAAIADAGRKIVLLGAPGAGKTTISRWLAIRYSRMHLDGRSYSIPIHVQLRNIDISAIHNVDDLTDSCLNGIEKFAGIDRARQYLKDNHHRLSLIIDGLDELPIVSKTGEPRTESLRRLYGILTVFLNADEGHQVLLTSRIQDYLHHPDFHFPGCQELLISDLAIEQIDETIGNWHRAAERLSVSSADQQLDWSARAHDIRMLVRGDTELAAFAANPLCLNLLQLVYQRLDARHLSVSRICELAIRTLLSARNMGPQSSTLSGTELPPSDHHDYVFGVLSDIAVEALDSVAVGKDGSVTFDKLQSIVTTRLRATTATGFIRAGSLIHPIMMDLVRGHGVLISMNTQYFMFAHNLFRDVLAAHALWRMSPEEVDQRARLTPWTRAFRHVAGLMHGETGPMLEAAALAGRLFDSAQTLEELPTLSSSAEIVAELHMLSPAFSRNPLVEGLISRFRSRLVQYLTDRNIEPNQRLELGLHLGRMGDPRVVAGAPGGPGTFVNLAPARITLGSEIPNETTNPKYRAVYPPLLEDVQFEEFWMSRYLITNDQFAEFIDDGGYSINAYWTEDGGLNWLDRDDETVAKLRDLMRRSSMTHFYTDIHNGRVTEPEIDDALDAMLFRKLPLFWYDRNLNGPNQPVVGINWWEAKAFCRWFSHRRAEHVVGRAGYKVDLPTEYEWERSARLGGRKSADTIWALGSAEENAHWNTLHRLAPRSAPVGAYPWGSPSPDGPHDLIGNVWEWTTSAKHSYAHEHVHDSFPSARLDDRMVRGGSWLSSEPLSATTSFRSYDPPCNAYDDLGFRIVVAPQR